MGIVGPNYQMPGKRVPATWAERSRAEPKVSSNIAALYKALGGDGRVTFRSNNHSGARAGLCCSLFHVILRGTAAVTVLVSVA